MFKIVIEEDHQLLTLSGRISIENTQQLKSLFADLDSSRDLIVDAKELEYIDSSGVACLLIGYKKLTAGGHKLVLREPSEALTTVLKILKFDGLFDFI